MKQIQNQIIRIKYEPTVKKFEGQTIPQRIVNFFDDEVLSHDEKNGIMTIQVGCRPERTEEYNKKGRNYQ